MFMLGPLPGVVMAQDLSWWTRLMKPKLSECQVWKSQGLKRLRAGCVKRVNIGPTDASDEVPAALPDVSLDRTSTVQAATPLQTLQGAGRHRWLERAVLRLTLSSTTGSDVCRPRMPPAPRISGSVGGRGTAVHSNLPPLGTGTGRGRPN